MSRTVRSMVTTVVATLALAIAVSAAPAKTAKTAKAHSIVGTVQKYDPASKTLTIGTDKGTETVMVSTDTHVMSGSKMLTLDQLSAQAGTRVKVSYTDANGQKTAKDVRIAAAPTKTASASASKKPAKK